MKKFSAILVMVLTIFSCFIFSACGGKYSKLKMQFMINGEKVENAVLFIDETNCDEGASVDLQVKFSGIKKKHVGKIDVSSTNKNVEFSNVSYDKMTATFTVTALTSGEIPVKVLHLNSNKSILINLKVEKKSTDVEILNPNYIIQIPEEGVNSHTLKIKDCLALSLSNDLTYGECTDKVYAGLENETVPNGVEVKTTNVDGVDLISGFTVSSEAEAYEFTIYPITTMHSYDKTSFKDKEIKISLVKSEDLNVSLELKNNNQENDENSNVEKYNPLYLIANHTSSKYNTKTIEFNENLLEYYNFTVESSEHILAEKIANNSFTLYSGNKTDETEKVNATFIPKYVGDIETVTKTINVKSEVMPHSINVLKDGKETSADSFEIFDYYANGQGQVFKFVPKEDYSFSSMMGMRIVLNKADLSENNSTSTEVGTNKNLLEFRTSSKGILSFVVNGENVVSDVISKNETVYVKYVESESGNPNSTANITIQSVYTGEEDYLTGINLTSKDLTFEMKKGVAEVEGVYGVVTFMDNIPYHTRIKSLTFENENNEYVSQKLYLKNTDTNYLINLTKLLDQNDQEIDKHTFKVKVLGNGQNNLKLTYNGETKEEFDYLYTKSEKQPADKDNSPYLKTSNSMILDPTSADVGEYKIEIDAGNYLKYVVRVYVCEDIKNAIEIEEGKYDLILNEDVKKIETSWIAENGLDYALASGQTVTFTTKLNNSIISSQLVSGYGYEVSGLDSIDTYISLPNNVDNEDNQVTCSLNEGTCVDGDNKYITLTIKINYFDIDKMEIIKDEIKSAIIEKTIFIYEELKDENISINKTNVNLYSANKVSPYYSNLTTEELKVILNESVKNYGVNYSWYFEGAIIKYNESENRNEFTNTDEVVAIGTPSNEEKLPLAPKNMERATRIIYVTVSQYGVEYTRRVDVRINEPYYTSNLIVTSDLNVDSDANFYIDLKDQESYKIEVDYVDENGQSLEFKDFTGESLNNLEVIVTDQFNNIQIK